MKKNAALLLLLLLLAGAVHFVYRESIRPSGALVEVEIPRGASGREAARRIAEALRRPVFDIRLAISWSNLDRRILAGRYRFHERSPLHSIVETLRAGPIRPRERVVTIPEGLDLAETADLFDSAGIVPRAEFLAAVRGRDLEGLLFPDTYRFLPGATAEEVVERLAARWREVIPPLYAKGKNPGGLSLARASALASIVEAEARVREEQPVIAAVFLRRLKIGMRLEADPTVRFATGKKTGPVLYADLDHPSPYNTYRAYGIPPGPIGSFGAGAFEAVMNPADTDVLFFVAAEDGSGRHLFSRTLTAHNRARGTAKRNAGRR